jgi:hypothetical protein
VTAPAVPIMASKLFDQHCRGLSALQLHSPSLGSRAESAGYRSLVQREVAQGGWHDPWVFQAGLIATH